MTTGERIREANEEAIRRLTGAQPRLVDVRRAGEVVPGLGEGVILHAGPPVPWERMCGPMRGAVAGAMVFEGWASSVEEAALAAARGRVSFDPCHHHQAVGPMAGVLSPSMWVFCVEDATSGRMAYCSLNEGLGKVLRFGANSPEVLDHLRWMGQTLGPALSDAVKRSGGLSVKALTAQALLMGDECHNRNVAATSLFLKALTPHLMASDLSRHTLIEIFRFIAGNDHFFLNLSMAACKATADAILGLEGCSIVSAMARNGTEIGIRVAGLGDRWFTAPAGQPKGLYFAGFTEADACRDLGDSTISETVGIGGYAMAAAPAITRFIGGAPRDALRYTREMSEISLGRHKDYLIPSMDYAGAPVGTDIRLVVETAITPIINTGIAHKDPGVGQIGAGILYAPLEPFQEALRALDSLLATPHGSQAMLHTEP